MVYQPVRNKIFISYSRRDRVLLERLQTFLRPLERLGTVDRWDDTRIQPGQNWRGEIQGALDTARVAVLLVSADFVASDFIATNELPPLLAAAKDRGLVILPVILSYCQFDLIGLAEFQAVNNPEEPLLALSSVEQDRIWVNLSQRIEEVLSQPVPVPEDCPAAILAQHVQDWFNVLDYRKEDHEVCSEECFEWIILVPVWRGYNVKILVHCIVGESQLHHLNLLQEAVEQHNTAKGWLISHRRISPAAREALQQDGYHDLYCYTLDDLIDRDADFSPYLAWLEAEEIKKKGIDTSYVPLACIKEEIDPVTGQQNGISRYGEDNGWIEGYVNRWLDDPTKEHLSVLGEFGTGKTWFALHYAWMALQKYKEAKQQGTERPRIPLVVPLRDYAKAVSAKSLFSEFFFSKHTEIALKKYAAFEQLNRMGKLLLIFDGFDEIAARVSRQEMIDNFWELAKVIVPGSKVIITCRTECFQGTEEELPLLNADLRTSTTNLTGDPPQFEVLELEKFSDQQIQQVLSQKAKEQTVADIMGNSALMDLARRPVMVELILEALPDIEAGKPVDISRIYLYAVRRKMERDIKTERTFTSMADKLYFLCELSWEMLSTDQMSLNYREFPKLLQRLFSSIVKNPRDLDYWKYDMMGQTMLVRNSGGDYSPAHRSLLEFFAAYKLVASLGVLAEDFTAMAQQQTGVGYVIPVQAYTWTDYFQRSESNHEQTQLIAPLQEFVSLPFEQLLTLLSQSRLAKAVLDLATPMLRRDLMMSRLLLLIQGTKRHLPEEVGYLGGNVAQLLLADSRTLEQADLNHTVVKGVDFAHASLRGAKFTNAVLEESIVPKVFGSVTSVLFSPDGQLLAMGESNGTVQVWNRKTLGVILLCRGNQNWVWSLAFSPDGKILASGSSDHTIKLWSVKSGECLHTLIGHENWVRSVAFSPDGKTLASGSSDHTIKLWSVKSGECLYTLIGHENWVRSVAFSPDGKTLASGSSDHTIKLWSVESRECLYTLTGHENWVRSVAFSPDGKTLASGSSDHTIKLWSVKSGECLYTLIGHENWVRSVTFSPDGKTLASSSDDQTIRLWSLEHVLKQTLVSEECLTLSDHQHVVLSTAFSPDGETLVSSSSDHTIKLWSVKSGECFHTLTGQQNGIRSIAFKPDGSTIASGSDDQTIKLWSVATGECCHTLTGHHNAVWSITLSPDEKTLASGSFDHTIKLWSVKSGECLHTLTGHLNGVRSVAFSPDGSTLASGSSDQTIKLWSVANGTCLHTLADHTNAVCCMAFSPDESTLASGSDDYTIKLWSVANGTCLHTLADHTNAVWSVAFSPDGKTLASSSDDQTIKLWSVESRECFNTLTDHRSWVRSVAFSPDGSTLASGSDDYTIKLWSVANGTCLRTLTGHLNGVRSVAFSPDGSTLASGSSDQMIKLWSVKSGECLRSIADRLCEGLEITGVEGLSKAQKAALKLLGAVEDN